MSQLPVLSPNASAGEALARVMDPSDIPPGVAPLSSTSAVASLLKDQPRVAVRLIAGWLSTREAIWWAALCQAQIVKVGANPGPQNKLKAIVAWVKDPEEKSWNAVARETGPADNSPVGILAQAVTLTAENISPVKEHPVTCSPGLAHRMAAVSILGALAAWPGPNRNECLHHFIELGLDVSEGKHLWAPNAMGSHPGLRPGSQPTTPRGTGNIWEKW